jgi:ABC-type transport system involved in multi-copper enzyme maturation permease subunit
MTAYAPSIRPGRVTLAGLLRSEWTKLRTVRSTVWTLAMGFTRAHWLTESPAARAVFDPVEVSLMPTYLGGSLLLGILGILVVSGEYAHGTIRVTFAADPRRPMVLTAKVLVFAALSLVVAEVTSFASFLVGEAFLTSPAKHVTLSSPGALRAVAGIGLFLCVSGLLALGMAVIIRHTAGAIGAYAFVQLVAPIIVAAFPHSLQEQVSRWLPMSIGATMIGDPGPNAFAPWTGFALLCAYAAAALAAGAVTLVRRDA